MVETTNNKSGKLQTLGSIVKNMQGKFEEERILLAISLNAFCFYLSERKKEKKKDYI